MEKKENPDSIDFGLNLFPSVYEGNSIDKSLMQVLQEKPNDDLKLEAGESLALFARHSIERGFPIPRNMLSKSDDVFNLQHRSYQQNQSVKIEEDSQKFPLFHNDLVSELHLRDLLTNESEINIQNTKNVLRNFGNAQNHFCLYNKEAKEFINNNISDPKSFTKWVHSLKMENFDHFKNAWTSNRSKIFTRVYRKLCWKFYSENAIPYVLNSRIKETKTRLSHLRYIFRFLEGLQIPEEFSYFKKIDKN